MSTPAVLLLAVLTGTLAVARATRLITSDRYPPMLWLRLRFINWTYAGPDWRKGWQPLAECPFCVAPYAAAVNLTWALIVSPWAGDFSTWSAGWWWWIVNLWAAVSYAAAMVVVRDEPPAED